MQNYINSNLATYLIDAARLSNFRTKMQTENASNGQIFSETIFNQAMVEVKKYDLRKIYFNQNPSKLAVFNPQSIASPAQICADGNFETWPIANPFVFKMAIFPTNGIAQTLVTTGSDFVPFAVGTGVNNFSATATLVSPGADPVIPSVTRVLAGNGAIKLNNTTSGGKVITMSKNYVINQNNFDFNYSVILNDPPGLGHNQNEKPFFLVRVYDTSNNILRSVNILSNAGDCSFTTTPAPASYFGNILKSGWRCARINTADLLGQNVRVEFIISDCNQGAHFGTVYIDNICNSNCSNPLFGSIDLNQIPTINCPTTNQNICGTYQNPQNSIYNNIKLNITQGGSVVSTIAVPTTINTTTKTFCFTVPPSAFGPSRAGDYEFQVVGTFTRQCAVGFQLDPIYDNSANDLGVDVNFKIPTFNFTTTLCVGGVRPVLPTTSINGVIGTWSPATVSNTATANYTFTPNAGQCGSVKTVTITVNQLTTPTFNFNTNLCAGATAPILPTTSINGITGTWLPATVSNTTTANYIFTATAGQCARNQTVKITVTQDVLTTANDAFTFNQSIANQNSNTFLSNDTYNGYNISSVSPAFSVVQIGTSPVLAAGGIIINANGSITLLGNTPVGNYTVQYKLLSSCGVSSNVTTITITVNAALTGITCQPLGSFTGVCWKTTAQTTPVSIYDLAFWEGDGRIRVNGVLATPSMITITPTAALPAGITLNANGTLNIAGGTLPNYYIFNLQICPVGSTSGCKTISVNVNINKTITASNIVTGISLNGRILHATSGSTCAGLPLCQLYPSVLSTVGYCYPNGTTQPTITPANVVISNISPTSQGGIKINTITGNFELANIGTAVTYSSNPYIFTYTICDYNYPTTMCYNLTATVKVFPFTARMANPNLIKYENSFDFDSMQIAPNPSKAIFYISFNEILEETAIIEIYNLIGQKVFETNISNTKEKQLDLNDLSSGSYMLKATYNDEVISKRIVKE